MLCGKTVFYIEGVFDSVMTNLNCYCIPANPETSEIANKLGGMGGGGGLRYS